MVVVHLSQEVRDAGRRDHDIFRGLDGVGRRQPFRQSFPQAPHLLEAGRGVCQVSVERAGGQAKVDERVVLVLSLGFTAAVYLEEQHRADARERQMFAGILVGAPHGGAVHELDGRRHQATFPDHPRDGLDGRVDVAEGHQDGHPHGGHGEKAQDDAGEDTQRAF